MLLNRKAFATPISAYDCETKEEVLIRPWPLFWAGDNPMQAELCSTAGLTSNYFCRTCKAGGSQEFKQSGGYESLFKVSHGFVTSLYID
jgi:hypothetical protein